MSKKHLSNLDGDYVCTNWIKINTNKITKLISEVNCEDCLEIIRENGLDLSTNRPISQTSLKGFC